MSNYLYRNEHCFSALQKIGIKKSHSLENWQHSHDFSIKNDKGKRRTRYVLIFTVITMFVEMVVIRPLQGI